MTVVCFAGLLRQERRVGDRRLAQRTQRIRLRVLSQREILQHRIHVVHASSLHLLRHERHSAEHGDVDSAAVDFLLSAQSEGSDRRRRAVVVPDLSAQRH